MLATRTPLKIKNKLACLAFNMTFFPPHACSVDEPTVGPGLTNVECTGGQNHILRCDYSLNDNCAPSDAVAIECCESVSIYS